MEVLSRLLSCSSVPHLVVGKFEHLQPTETIAVFHGTTLSTALEFLSRGIDATKVVGRYHNQGAERGLYVTPDSRTAFDFGHVVLEFTVKASDLYPTARWGLGTGRKTDIARTMAQDKYPNSFRPLVSWQLNESVEPQAMFIGFAPAASITRVYAMRDGQLTSVSPEDFLQAAGGRKRAQFSGTESPSEILQKVAEYAGSSEEEIRSILSEDTSENSWRVIETLAQMGVPRKLIYRVLPLFRKNQAVANISDIVAIPNTITVDGHMRPTRNAQGKLIYPTLAGIKNFWRWFGDSRAVDISGKPIVYYHGSIHDIREFRNQHGYNEQWNLFTDDPEYAKHFTSGHTQGGRVGGSIYPVYLKIDRALDLRDLPEKDSDIRSIFIKTLDGHGVDTAGIDIPKNYFKWLYEILSQQGAWGDLGKRLNTAGYDSVIFTDTGNGVTATTTITTDNHQIKSAIGNSGAFSLSTSVITASAAKML